MKQLFYNQKDNVYFLCFTDDEEGIICPGCQDSIVYGETCVLHRSWSKKGFNNRIWCLKCVDIHSEGVIDSIIVVNLCGVPPEGCIVVSDCVPELMHSKDNLTVFQAADIQIGE